MTPPGGSHGKPHQTTKILSRASRCGGGVAARGARAVSAFRDGLKFADGHNIAIDFRSAENKLDRLPAFAADLVHRQVAVMVGQQITMRAAMAASVTVH
jgi:hypothetical protein